MECKTPIKICALTTISKAMEWFVVDPMRKLSQNGYEVTLICNMEDEFAEKNSDFAKCINIPMGRGISIKDLLTVPFRLRKIFKENNFDVIYYMSPNVSMYASLGGLLAGIKKRVYSQCGLRYVSFTGLKRKIFWLVEKFTCMMSTTIRAQSPKNMQFAIDEKLCPASKISVVGIGGTTGVDLKQCDAFDHDVAKQEMRSKYHIPADAFVFGYIGRLNADKGVNELIAAFQKVHKKYPNTYLALVGMLDNTNPITPEALQIAKESPEIVMTGNVPSDQVYPHAAMFDVLTHPTYREGFGKVLQEAMGVGIPIITTDVPGPSEVVVDGKTGILVEAKNSADLAEKMEQMYMDQNMREKMAKAGRERAEKYFDRPIMLENLLNDFNSIMERVQEEV